MIKFGRLIGVPYVLCLNHTIHLAVTDKLFTKKFSDENSEEVYDSTDGLDDDDSVDDDGIDGYLTDKHY